jgi:hypothetical protein
MKREDNTADRHGGYEAFNLKTSERAGWFPR